MSFIGFTDGVFFSHGGTFGKLTLFLKPCTEFVAVVKMVLLEEGLIFKETTQVWTHYHGWLKLGLSKHITAFLA